MKQSKTNKAKQLQKHNIYACIHIYVYSRLYTDRSRQWTDKGLPSKLQAMMISVQVIVRTNNSLSLKRETNSKGEREKKRDSHGESTEGEREGWDF